LITDIQEGIWKIGIRKMGIWKMGIWKMGIWKIKSAKGQKIL